MQYLGDNFQELNSDGISTVFGGGSCHAYQGSNCSGSEKNLGNFNSQSECSKSAESTYFGGWLNGEPAKSFKFGGDCINFNFQTQT